MQEKEPILKVEDLHFTYNGEKTALNGVDLNIYEGEKIAVLGSNGAGKSTFFLNINGVLKSHHGDIYYRGEKITKKNLNDLRKNVGIVFQDADNQIIASTVMAEVSFGPMNLKLPKKEVISRVDKALEYMNISEFKDRPPHYLSGGEKKRVSIADIIAMESEVIIFDEPTAALDPLNAAMLEEVLQKMGATAMGARVVIVPTEVPMEMEIKHPMTNSPATATLDGRMDSPKFTVLSAPPAALTAPEKAPAARKIRHMVIIFSSPTPFAASFILSANDRLRFWINATNRAIRKATIAGIL